MHSALDQEATEKIPIGKEREYVQNNMEFINPPEAGKHPGFSHGVKVPCSSLLFVAGQVGWDENGKVVSTEFVGQFAKALSNVLAVVRQAGASRPTSSV